MKLRIRVEWGGVTAYMDDGLFDYCWDGGGSVEGGVPGLEPANRAFVMNRCPAQVRRGTGQGNHGRRIGDCVSGP